MVQNEPLLKEYIGNDDEQFKFSIEMKSLDEHNRGEKNGKNMSSLDLRLVKKCMAMDLSKVINWDKSGQAMQIFGSSIPYHFEGFNETYWKDIASKKWDWPSVILSTSEYGALEMAFDMSPFA